MKEITIVPGRHECGTLMEMRLADLEVPKKQIWIVYGLCHKCKMIIACNLFEGNEPIQNVDFIIDEKEIARGKVYELDRMEGKRRTSKCNNKR